MVFEEYHVRFLLFPFKSLYSFSGEIGLKIHVKFLATIREITDKSEIELELHSGDTVGTALQALQTALRCRVQRSHNRHNRRRDSESEVPG
jgi:hypothetical protein